MRQEVVKLAAYMKQLKILTYSETLTRKTLENPTKMTRQEADALKSYIDFMADQTAEFEKLRFFHSRGVEPKSWHGSNEGPNMTKVAELSDEAKAAFTRAVEKNFNKSRERYTGPPEGAKLVAFETTNHAGDAALYAIGSWVEEGLKQKPVMSFAEFKGLLNYPDKCQVWAHPDVRKDIISLAENLGYTLAGEIQHNYMSILEFTLHKEPQYVSIEKLLDKYMEVGGRSNVGNTQMCDFAKLVRTLTIAEYKGDGCYEAEPNNIKLPKDFTL